MKQPHSTLFRYAYGYSDKKPGKLFWLIHIAMIIYVLYNMVSCS